MTTSRSVARIIVHKNVGINGSKEIDFGTWEHRKIKWVNLECGDRLPIQLQVLTE